MNLNFPEGRRPSTSFIAKATIFSVLAIIALLIIAWINPLYSVPTGYRGVITVGGSIKSVQNEGYLLVWPWEKLNVFNVRAEAANIRGAEGSTSDQQIVHVSLTVRYNVLPSKVAEVFEQFSKDGNLDNYVETATQEAFKAVTARFTAPELISKRPEVSAALVTQLTTKIAPYGAKVIGVDMTNFQFSKSYTDAINEKTTQEQLRQAADNKTQTVIATEKQRVAVAEAEAAAARARADGEAYAALKIATAQADALKIQNSALAQNKDVLDLRRIEVELEKAKRWDGKLPQNMYGSGPVPFISLDKK